MASRDDEQAYRDVLNLAILEGRERSSKEKALMKRIGKSRGYVREHRERLIEDALRLRPELHEDAVAAWVDTVLGVEKLQ